VPPVGSVPIVTINTEAVNQRADALLQESIEASRKRAGL